MPDVLQMIFKYQVEWGIYMEYGILTLLPIVVVVTPALLSKRTLEPLVAGSVVAYMIISGWHFPQAWGEAFFNVASNRDYQWVFMVCALFGSLIALLGASHGTPIVTRDSIC